MISLMTATQEKFSGGDSLQALSVDTWKDAWRVILTSMDPNVTVRLSVTYKAVKTSRLETRATEFVLYASVLHANEECEAKAIFTKYLS
jgi:hypothetical protein